MGEERVLTQEEKFKAIAQALQYPEGRAKIGQTMCSNVALGSNTKMKSSLYAGKSENSPLLSGQESENVRDADNQQGRIDTVKCLLCNEVRNKIYRYLFPSETICEQSSIKKDCDIVRTTQRCVEIGRNSYPPEEVLVSTCLH